MKDVHFTCTFGRKSGGTGHGVPLPAAVPRGASTRVARAKACAKVAACPQRGPYFARRCPLMAPATCMLPVSLPCSPSLFTAIRFPIRDGTAPPLQIRVGEALHAGEWGRPNGPPTPTCPTPWRGTISTAANSRGGRRGVRVHSPRPPRGLLAPPAETSRCQCGVR